MSSIATTVNVMRQNHSLRESRGAFDWILSAATRPVNLYRFALMVIFGLPIMTFTMPGKPSPSDLTFFDSLALLKVTILAFAVFVGAGLIYANRRRGEFRFAIGMLTPFFVFLAWAIASVMWSPLKSGSLGQAGGLCALLFHCVIVAALCQNKLNTSRILKYLCYSLIAFGVLILAVYCVSPIASGMDRSVLLEGGDGMVHPTASGAAAALGLLITTLCLVVGRFPWANRAMLISLLVNGPLLFLSNSRTATLLAAATIPLAVYLFSSIRQRGAMLLLFTGFAAAYLVWDPGFIAVQDSVGVGLQYLSRGQSITQIQNVSGRTEMWTAVWNGYHHAPIIGHGYFVTSPTGELYVWNEAFNHTAHNLFLQVLVSTGLIGLVIFLFAIGKPAIRILALRGADLFSRHLLWMLSFVAIWYLGWTIGCVSFMGPMRSESIVFFTLFGIGIGDLYRATRQQDKMTGLE